MTPEILKKQIKNYNMIVHHHGDYAELKRLQENLNFFLRTYSWAELFGGDVMMLVTDNKVGKDILKKGGLNDTQGIL